MQRRKNISDGFSYIELITSSTFIIIIFTAFISLISTSYKFIGISKTQTTARSIANQQLELIRNLPYDSVGTISGIPNGSIPQNTTKNINGQNYFINTSIIYIDDPFDGTSPIDILPSDYKSVRIRVTWDGPFTSTEKGITLLTHIVPKGIESSLGGGTLAIVVFDSNGQPIPQAQVQISAPNLLPPINLELQTDIYGNLVIPGAPICTACYQIVVTKDSYSTDQTYSNTDIPNPQKPHQTILENQLTQISFAIDKLSTVQFTTYNYPNLNTNPNTSFLLIGDKIIGTDTNNQSIYKFNQTITTNSQGIASINLEWDNYHIYPLNELIFAGSNPITPITILPNQNNSINIAFSQSNALSLLNLVKDASGSAIANVTGILKKDSFEASSSTGLESQVNHGFMLFTPPEIGVYSIQLSHPNYETATSSIEINGNESQIFILNNI